MIQEQNVREGMGLAVGILALTGQVSESFVAIGYNRALQAFQTFTRSANQRHILAVVRGKKNRKPVGGLVIVAFHLARAFRFLLA